MRGTGSSSARASFINIRSAPSPSQRSRAATRALKGRGSGPMSDASEGLGVSGTSGFKPKGTSSAVTPSRVAAFSCASASPMLTRRCGRGGAAGGAVRTIGGAVVSGSGDATGASLLASERAMRAFTLATFAFATDCFGAGFFAAGFFDAAFFGAGFFAVTFDFDVDFFDFDFGGVFFRVATASELATAPWVVARHLA